MQCVASFTERYFRRRPHPPADAPNEVHRIWQYEKGLCDVCGQWVPLTDRPAARGATITKRVLSKHERES
jgi:hypothetical protein